MFDAEIAAASRTYNVPVAWISAVIETESSWNPSAYRAEPQINDASYGLMQLLERTARGLGFSGPVGTLYEPSVNIDLGTKLLAQLRARYGDDFRRIYSAYNSGNPDKFLTSSEVARNVSRAVDNLARWISQGAATLTSTPESAPIVGLLVLILLWAWTSKRK